MLRKEDDRRYLERRIADLGIKVENYWKDKSHSSYMKAFLDYVDIYLKIFSSNLGNQGKTELLIVLLDIFYELKGLPRPRRRHIGIRDIEKEISETIEKEKEHKLKKVRERKGLLSLISEADRYERYKITVYILILIILISAFLSYSYYNYPLLSRKDMLGLPSRNITGNLTGVVITKEERLNFATILKRNIENLEWFEDTRKVVELDNYFFDPDGDILSYKIENLQNIRALVEHETGRIIFSQDDNWHGTERAVVEASDGLHTIQSNEFELNVLPIADCGLDGCEIGENSDNCELDCKIQKVEKAEGEEKLGKENKTAEVELEEVQETKELPYSTETGQKVQTIEQRLPSTEQKIEALEKPKEYQARSTVLFGLSPIFRITDSAAQVNRTLTSIDIESLSPSPIPCVITTRIDRSEPFVFNTSHEDKGIKIPNSEQVLNKGKTVKDYSGIIPEGYDIIIPIFNVNCRDEEIEFTLNVPNNYIDVKALKCSENNCSQQRALEVTELKCGNQEAKEVSRKEKFYQPMFVEVNITTINFTSFEDVLRSGKNTVKFAGDRFEGLTASIIFPEERVPQPSNPSSVILNTFILKIEKSGKSELNSAITMPYALAENVDENSLGMYFKYNNTWNYFGGEIDKAQKVVTGGLANVSRYLDNKGEVQIAIIGSICINCLKTNFKQVYNPLIPSRDAVVLVHGIASNPATFQEIIDDFRLSKQPWQVWTFGYPSYQRIEQNANEFEDFLQANSDKYDTLYIVAHSTGGLISQKAVYDSYIKNLNDSTKYYYAKKVKKLVLIATPNNGSPVAEFYYNMINFVINSKNFYNPVGKQEITEEMLKGLVVPRVPWVKYYAIAGLRPYEISAIFFKASSSAFFKNEDNDGVVGVRSAQFVGSSFINNTCKEYWGLNLTHTELIDDYLARKLIEQVIAKEVIDAVEGVPVAGYNSYYEIKTKCNKGDRFIVMGKRISKARVYDPFGCSCGNNVCGIGENERNCPQDCKSKRIKINERFALLAILGLIAVLFIVSKVMSKKYGVSERAKEKEKKAEKRPAKIRLSVFKKAEEEEKKLIRKIKDLPEGYQTDIDILYKMLIEKKRLKMGEIASNFGITAAQAEEWARILEEYKLAKIHYPLFGDAELILVE